MTRRRRRTHRISIEQSSEVRQTSITAKKVISDWQVIVTLAPRYRLWNLKTGNLDFWYDVTSG